MKGFAGSIALLVFMATPVQSKAGGEKSRHLDIAVVPAEPDRCRVEMQGRSYLLPEARNDLQAALVQARKSADWLHLTNDMTTPWRCMGEVMSLGAKAKFKKVGFISEPPSDAYPQPGKVR